MKKLNTSLNSIICSFLGVFIGHVIYVVWDYKKHPGFYALQSAPWYTSILVYGIGAAVVIVIALIIKWIIRKKIR